MSRPKKQTVDYFPHSAISGKTIYNIESRWGNDGYAFWFKLLETLCQSDGHVFDYSNPVERDYLLAKARISDVVADEILNKLAEWGNIDPELWKTKKIWCDNLVINIKDAYKKRIDELPIKPISATGNTQNNTNPVEETKNNSHSGDGNRESKVKKSKVKEIKEKENDVQLHFVDPLIESAWDEWIDYKKKVWKFTFVSNKYEQIGINELVDLCAGDYSLAHKIVGQSIYKKWRGLFELKNSPQTIPKSTGGSYLSAYEKASEEFRREVLAEEEARNAT